MIFKFEALRLDLAVTWKISRNSSNVKTNYVFTICEGSQEFQGEIAPNVRYGETPEKVISELEQASKQKEILDLERILNSAAYSNSVKCGIEQAVLAYKSYKQNKTLAELLSLEPASVQTSFSIPIMDEELLEDYINHHSNYTSFKVKVNKQNALSFTFKIATLTNKPLRIDANESFSSAAEFLVYYNQIKHLNIEFIEQPMPSSIFDEYIKLKPKMIHPLVADESIEDCANFTELKKGFDVINLKLMKTGGILNALSLIADAKNAGLGVMIGCMIESSLGISYAMNLAYFARFVDLDGALLLKKDPHQNLLKYSNSKISF